MEINGYEFELNDEVKKLLADYKADYAPPKDQVFRALELTPLAEVKVVILGQDPYPVPGDACGLSFSVDRTEKLPKSLNNMYKELVSDLGIARKSGDLSDWAMQGVLLLNTVLTVTENDANSHRKKGWLDVTHEIIEQVAAKENVVFVLLGKQAEQNLKLIGDCPTVIAPHPSPLSAYRGFFGSNLYSQINDELENVGESPIKW